MNKSFLINSKIWFCKSGRSIVTKKTDLASLKSDVDELDIDMLKAGPLDLSKLSDVVKSDAVKTCVWKIVTKVNAIDTTRIVFKTQCNTNELNPEKKIMMLT